MAAYRSGFVAVVGRPNVGKSTMVNALVGEKISIVSDKVQTTRRRALGVLTTGEYQIAFIDTPGIHAPHHRLGRALNETAKTSLVDADVVLVVVNGGQDPTAEDRQIAELMRQSNLIGEKRAHPVILCINKMDLLKPHYVEPRWAAFHELFEPDDAIMTCMTKEHNLKELVALLVSKLPEAAPMYDEDTYTDQSMRTLSAEIVREKAIRQLRQEVPHALATYVEEWEEEERRTVISCVLLCETEGQKAILIGKRGKMLRTIGTEARLEIEKLIERPVFLELFVKVRTDWRQSERHLRELDYLNGG
ncbi:MAG TPA: GTPase Era [Fimbriimonadaceae bacterium]|nr:GTPase Era [Armatimonadetes bacterium Uphvl-Ar2]HAY12983.1 GTPase Era [Armatimonadota bacterium]HRD32215.1 GTPase Era [Fimbriimonadaceae bacterium]HCM73308.1 GTPase Era [Armatimonadota bacterium]HRE93235.1 GTPase Era [Fimbriimonadaceae bacterium]